MTDDIIRVSKNGSRLIPAARLRVEEDGKPTEGSRKTVALCRRGGFSNKSCCDGTHKRNGFTAEEAILRLR